MLFPLRLTPFEEYMLLDSQPAYPMSCFFKISLKGQFDLSIFAFALQETLINHPLLSCSVIAKRSFGRQHVFYWHNTGTIHPIARQPLEAEPLNANQRFPPSQGINLFQEPALKVTVCNPITDPNKTHLKGQTNIVFEVHHSASDASGIARFIEDVLCCYARQTRSNTEQRPAVKPEALKKRGAFGWKRNKLNQLWGIFRAWTFLLNRVMPLTPQTGDAQTIKESKPSADYPAILCRNLTESETQTVLNKAKQLGITVNDLFLGSAFLAMKHCQMKQQQEKNDKHNDHTAKSNLRIAVPTNLRTPSDESMPAANVVSMVFLDRLPKNIQPTQEFYLGVYKEMQHIKRCSLGWAFIFGLTIYRFLFGSFKKMMKPNRCWATATVTNLGRLFTDTPLTMREGRVQIDAALELIGVEACPPIRTLTALGCCVMTYADCLTVNLHYDSDSLSNDAAELILDGILNEVACTMTPVK